MVKAGFIAVLCLAAAPVEACRLALVLALDVSSSVDADEDLLQRRGLAAALLSADVEAAFFAGSEPVALQIFEWSGQGHQTDLLDWTLIQTPQDLISTAETLYQSMRSARGLPTAMGHALGYASIKLQNGPNCLFQTVDIAGDGANNQGFGPRDVYATFPFDGVIVNGLVIMQAEESAETYFRTQVIRGPGAFVEVANGFAEFETTMRRKLIRELTSQIVGQGIGSEDTRG